MSFFSITRVLTHIPQRKLLLEHLKFYWLRRLQHQCHRRGCWRRHVCLCWVKDSVISQISELAKAFTADTTFVRPLPIMDKHVGPQVTWCRERPSAQRALMRFFLHVRHFVIIQVTWSSEPFAANSTLVRFLSTVNPPVRIQRATGGEPLTTNIAHVWLFSRVGSHVSFQ